MIRAEIFLAPVRLTQDSSIACKKSRFTAFRLQTYKLWPSRLSVQVTFFLNLNRFFCPYLLLRSLCILFRIGRDAFYKRWSEMGRLNIRVLIALGIANISERLERLVLGKCRLNDWFLIYLTMGCLNSGIIHILSDSFKALLDLLLESLLSLHNLMLSWPRLRL